MKDLTFRRECVSRVRSSANHCRRLVLAGLSLVALAGSQAHAATKDSFWNVEDGDWLSPGNWIGGVPQPTGTDTYRAIFNVTGGSPAISNVTLAGSTTFDYFGIGFGKTLNLSMGNGALLEARAFIAGRTDGGTVKPSYFTVTGPATGIAEFKVSLFQIGGAATNNSNVVTFSGANLRVTDSGSNGIVGRQGNSHTLNIEGGTQYQGKGLVVADTTDIASGIGNNNKVNVKGAGTVVTLNGSAVGLSVASRGINNQNGTVQSGNTVTISDGARVTVNGETNTTAVSIGAAIYRSNNSILVTGEGARLEMLGDVKTNIGLASAVSDTTYNNRLTVQNGAAIFSEGIIEVRNGPNLVANRRNILEIGAGGTLATTASIENNGGLVRLADGGVLKGETALGAATAVSLNINGNGRLEAAGSGLGSSVQVVVGSETETAVLAIGLAGRTTAATLTLQTGVTMNANSALEVAIFGANKIDSIALTTGGSFLIDGPVSLSISLVGYQLKVGDTYQLFTGDASAVTGSFTVLNMPTLTGGLSWDTSSFNQAGGWTFAVVPEPSTYVLVLGFGLVALASQRRRVKLRFY